MLRRRMESYGSGRGKQRRIAQWNAYELERKKDFIANKLQFEKDLERIQMDVETAMVSGKDAAAQVHHVVLHGVPAKVEEEPDFSAWDALMAAPDPAQPSNFLQGALQAAQSNPKPSTLSPQP